MKLIAIDFPPGTGIHTAIRALNECELQHFLVQFVCHEETTVVGVFRGAREGDGDLVKDKLHDWIRRHNDALRRSKQAAAAAATH